MMKDQTPEKTADGHMSHNRVKVTVVLFVETESHGTHAGD